jgi:hypothetical protein
MAGVRRIRDYPSRGRIGHGRLFMDMTPEAGMVLSIIAGIAIAFAGIWYFLRPMISDKGMRVLASIWNLVKSIWPRK